MIAERTAWRWLVRATRAGFSLTELLVVLAIISIIMALLLPGLMMSRRHGQTTECVNNLRQIGFAMENFAADHDGEIPTELIGDDLFQQVISAQGITWSLLPTAYAQEVSGKSMADYYEDMRVVRCPSMGPDEAWSYGLNGQVLTVYKRYRDLENPSQTPMVFDSEHKRGYYYSDLAMRHIGCAQILYADTHVEPTYYDILLNFSGSVRLPGGLPPDGVWAEFSSDNLTVTAHAEKDLSNVVLDFGDGLHQKFETYDGKPMQGYVVTLSGTGKYKGMEIQGVWIKAGSNESGDGPGYGQYVDNPYLPVGGDDPDDPGNTGGKKK